MSFGYHLIAHFEPRSLGFSWQTGMDLGVSRVSELDFHLTTTKVLMPTGLGVKGNKPAGLLNNVTSEGYRRLDKALEVQGRVEQISRNILYNPLQSF